MLLLVLSYQYDYLRKGKNKSFWYGFILIVFILIAGLRYRLGVDSIRYEQGFMNYPTIDDLSVFDFLYSSHQPLYLILCSFARFLSDEFWVMQMLHSLLVNVVVFRFFRLNSQNVFLSILLYSIFLYTGFLFEAMRESCAVCMLLLGWEYVKKDRWIVFTIYILLATLFHISAIVLFMLPILRYLHVWDFLKINGLTIVYLGGIFVVGLWLQNVLFDYILQLNMLESMTEKADRYVDTDYAKGQLNIFGIIESCIRQLLIPFFACVILKKQGKLDCNVECMNLVCFTFIVLSFSISIFYRYSNYFYPFAIVAISDTIFLRKVYATKRSFISVNSYPIWCMCIVLIIFLQIRLVYCPTISDTGLKEYMKYYPYSNVISKELNNNRENVFRYYRVN